MQAELGTEAVVMTATAGKGHNAWGKYWRVAVVVVSIGYRPKRITTRNRHVVRILNDSPKNFRGESVKTCQYSRAIKYAERLAKEYNDSVTRLSKNALRNAKRRPLP